MNIKGLYRDELIKLITPVYRADQILQWVYEKQAESFDAMTNLPAPLRAKLAEEFALNALKEVKTRHATDTTEKFLFKLHDGSLIETVLIPATPGLTSTDDRQTVCVSTQAGCAFGCKFCASGLDGFKRNLSAAEIVDQVWQVQKLMKQKVNNIVVMGMGEPFANYENVLRALRILNAPWAFGIGARKMTVSTVGIVTGIRRLAEEPMQIRLAVSLHGATDEVRGKIMPINRKFPLKELMAACEYYAQVKGKMLTFEYILIENVNDMIEQAHKLAGMARRVHAKVNLIPYNPVEGLPWQRPDRDRCKVFQHVLRQAGISATLRIEKGTDIAAACGQLRLQHER
ncbi:MAG: 23S rRNA (adenine(2503)-C(2))-methyltransferase RlmN [Verrucomicrobia bacterium]|nr:23S rRNA (adenine(2503)-C(2))-methyltransferase RlmN [Verrucomicrobiota bacterium]